MNLSMLTMGSFYRWLQNAEVECKPCDEKSCVLAKWLQDEGFPEARVDGEVLWLTDEASDPDYDATEARMDCPKWAEAVVTAFDGMVKLPYQLHMAGQTSIGPEVYRAPLLTLLDSIVQADKAMNAAQDALVQA